MLEDKIKRLENDSGSIRGPNKAATRSSTEQVEHPVISPSSGISTSPYAIIGAAEPDSGTASFFGTSSAGTFMRNIQRIVQQKSQGDLWPPVLEGFSSNAYHDYGNDNHPGPRLIPDHKTGKPSVDYILPPRHVADNLMTLYWDNEHPFGPVLDKEQTQSDYDNIWRADSSYAVGDSFICLLNIILALSSQLDTSVPLDDRATLAARYYERARKLMDILEVGSVRSVQSYLILGQYFLSTQKSHHAWLYIGLAIRTAQSLGLHLPETSEAVSNHRTSELLRRVWHGCILTDRIVSTAYGRPCMISVGAAVGIPRPQAFDSERLPNSLLHMHKLSRPMSTAPSLVDFSKWFLDLTDILHDINLHYHYRTHQPNQQSRTIPEPDLSFSRRTYLPVLELEGRLESWSESIPPYLRPDNRPENGGADATLYRQAIVLQQWYVLSLTFSRHVSNHFCSSLTCAI